MRAFDRTTGEELPEPKALEIAAAALNLPPAAPPVSDTTIISRLQAELAAASGHMSVFQAPHRTHLQAAVFRAGRLAMSTLEELRRPETWAR